MSRKLLPRVLLLIFAACFWWISGKAVAGEEAVVRIAVVAPESGEWAEFGKEIRAGAQTAVTSINEKGGLLGKRVDLQVVPDPGTGEAAKAVARKLVKAGVTFVVGHYNSTSSIMAAPIYARAGVLMITPSSTNPMLTDGKLWNVVRTSGRDDVQGIFAGAFIAREFPGKRVAIVGDGTSYANGIVAMAQAALRESGVQPAVVEKLKPRQDDFSRLVRKFQANGIEVAFVAGLGGQTGRIVRQAAEAGLKVQFVTGDGAASGGIREAPGEALAGVLTVFSLDDTAGLPPQLAIIQLRVQGFEPFGYTLKAYAAVQVIAEGIMQAGSTDPRKVAAAIKSGGDYATALGRLTFDKKGDRHPPDTAMYVWRKSADGRINLESR